MNINKLKVVKRTRYNLVLFVKILCKKFSQKFSQESLQVFIYNAYSIFNLCLTSRGS